MVYKNKILGSVLLIGILFTNNLFANNDRVTLEADNNYGSRKATGKDDSRAYESTSLIDIENKYNDGGIYNYAEAVYYHLKNYQNRPLSQTVASRIDTANYNFNNDIIAQNQAEAQLQLLQEQIHEAATNEPRIEFISAYCTIPNEVVIERIASYTIARCDFDNYGPGFMAITLTPDFFSQALIGTPLYVNFNNNQKFTVSDGAILNATRTSINIATSVNDYKIQKIVAATGLVTADVTTRYVQQYLNERKAARTQETGGVNQVVDGVNVQTPVIKNTQQPKKEDYLAGAGIELVSGLIGIASNAFLDDLPYTFKIAKDTIIYVDARVDMNAKNMRGINYQPQNLIQKDEPRFDPKDARFSRPENAKDVGVTPNNNINNDGNTGLRK